MHINKLRWTNLLLSCLLVFPLLAFGGPVSAAEVKQVFMFGQGASGQLGLGGTLDRLNPTPVGAFTGANIKAVSAGNSHSLILTQAGEVYAFGNGANGRLGHGDDLSNVLTPKKVAALDGIVVEAVSAGKEHSLVLTEAGEVYSFGNGASGQLGHGSTASQNVPMKIMGLPDETVVSAISAGGLHSLLLTDEGQVYSFGIGTSGRLGHGDELQQTAPKHIETLTNIVAIAAGEYHSLAVDGSGKVYSFGHGGFGQLGHGDTASRLAPMQIAALSGENVIAISAGFGYSLVLTAENEVYSFGVGGSGHLGHGSPETGISSPKKIDALDGKNATAISAGDGHSVALTAAGEIYAFGSGFNGQLGYGQQHNRFIPEKIGGANNFTLIDAGGYYTIAVGTEDDSVTYQIGLSKQGEFVFYPKLVGYTSYAGESVTVTNTGTGLITELAVSLSGDNANDFEIVSYPSKTLAANATTNFSVRPKIGLAVGTYTATVNVTADRGVSASYDVRFVVTAEHTYTVDVTPMDEIAFGEYTTGYGFIQGQPFTVARTGTGDITNLAVSLEGDKPESFQFGTIAPGNDVLNDSQRSIVFRVLPRTGLPAGTHNAIVRITADNGINEQFNVSITVNAPPSISGHPENETVDEGGVATFAVVATGTDLIYEWQVDSGTGFVSLLGKNDPLLVIEDVVPAMDGYKYRVLVGGKVGSVQTSKSATLNVNPIPNQPNVTSAVSGNTQVQLNWQPVTGTPVTGYNVYVRTASDTYQVPVVTLGSDASSYTITSLTNGTSYFFVVTALNGGLESPNSNELSATPQVPAPGAPTLNAPAPGDTQVSLTWSGVDGATSYKLYQSTSSGDYGTEIATVDGAVNNYTVIGLTNGTMYYFIVKATNPGGDSADSNEVSAMPQVPAPETPVLESAVFGNAQVTLTWSGGAGAEDFKIYRSTTAGSDGTEIATVGGSVYSYTATGLMNGTTYYFVVKATNPGGDSASSNQMNATPITVPDAPLNVIATAGDGQAVITFDPPTSDGGSTITEYEVVASSGGHVVRGSSPVTVTGLTNGTDYSFTVKAVNDAGEGAASIASNVVVPMWLFIPVDTGTPAIPQNDWLEISVNGEGESIGKARQVEESGRTVITVSVDAQKLEDRLATEGDNAIVKVELDVESTDMVFELNADTAIYLADKKVTLEIRTNDAAYMLPMEQLQADLIAEQLGQLSELKDAQIQISIMHVQEEMAALFERVALEGGFTLMSTPLAFEISVIHGERNFPIATFSAYIEREMTLPDNTDPSKITTGIVVEPDGTVRHVPTRVKINGGSYYAVINSLTNSMYAVVWNPAKYSDVAGHWSEDAVNDMGARMVVTGTDNGTFNPDQGITRAEFIAFIVRALGIREKSNAAVFSDVAAADPYSGAVAAAFAYGLINGYEDGTFRPNDRITREQAMVVIAKAMDITGLRNKLVSKSASTILSSYTDAADTSGWAADRVADNVQAGIVRGRNNTQLAPKAFITRAEVAVMIQRLLQNSDLI